MWHVHRARDSRAGRPCHEFVGKSAVGTKCLEKRSSLDFTLSELSEMLSISLNSEENKMGVRASYKHFAATRLVFRQTSLGTKETRALLNRPLENRPHETHRQDRSQLPASARTSIHQTAASPAQARRVLSNAASLSPIPSDKRTAAHHTTRAYMPQSPPQPPRSRSLHRARFA